MDGKRWGEKARPLIVGALAGLGPLIDAEVDPRKIVDALLAYGRGQARPLSEPNFAPGRRALVRGP